MKLDECIREILENNFQSGDRFDTHTVIGLMLQNPDYHRAYVQGYHSDNDMTIGQYHGLFIGKVIGKTDLTDEVGVVKTMTIYGDLAVSTLWRKK